MSAPRPQREDLLRTRSRQPMEPPMDPSGGSKSPSRQVPSTGGAERGKKGLGEWS